jgi:hypothetical protein
MTEAITTGVEVAPDEAAVEGCCDTGTLSSCCEPEAKGACCGAPADEQTAAPSRCGCS